MSDTQGNGTIWKLLLGAMFTILMTLFSFQYGRIDKLEDSINDQRVKSERAEERLDNMVRRLDEMQSLLNEINSDQDQFFRYVRLRDAQEKNPGLKYQMYEEVK